jgi:threonine synthase
VSYDYGRLRLESNFRREKITHKKYAAFFPVNKRLVSLNEGGTELRRDVRLKGAWEGNGLHLKVETENPTRTFKDRGSSVEISKARELGFGEVCCASTGNMGLSLARYAREEGMKCTIFISKSANKEKIAKIRVQGAAIREIGGDFNDSLNAAESFAAKREVFLCGDYHYRKEGQKSLLFEAIEQMGYKVPDYIIVQVGNSTLLAAIFKGLKEFKYLGLISRIPRLIAVQSSRCDPIVRAYENERGVNYVRPKTRADAIAVGYPTFGFEGLNAVRATEGFAERVKDSEITKAISLLLKSTGIAAEPGGAAGLAGFLKICREKPKMFKGKEILVIITGNNEE